jgi:hypothetical protein
MYEELATIPEPSEVANDTVDVEGLGACEVLKVHDDGDLTIMCGGKKYMVTPEGDIFGETDLKAPSISDFISEE